MPLNINNKNDKTIAYYNMASSSGERSASSASEKNPSLFNRLTNLIKGFFAPSRPPHTPYISGTISSSTSMTDASTKERFGKFIKAQRNKKPFYKGPTGEVEIELAGYQLSHETCERINAENTSKKGANYRYQVNHITASTNAKGECEYHITLKVPGSQCTQNANAYLALPIEERKSLSAEQVKTYAAQEKAQRLNQHTPA